MLRWKLAAHTLVISLLVQHEYHAEGYGTVRYLQDSELTKSGASLAGDDAPWPPEPLVILPRTGPSLPSQTPSSAVPVYPPRPPLDSPTVSDQPIKFPWGQPSRPEPFAPSPAEPLPQVVPPPPDVPPPSSPKSLQPSSTVPPPSLPVLSPIPLSPLPIQDRPPPLALTAPNRPQSPISNPPYPPPQPGRTRLYRCRNDSRSLVGAELLVLKLRPPRSHAAAMQECRVQCDKQDGICSGYYYKSTGFCTLMKGEVMYTKPYFADLLACIFQGYQLDSPSGLTSPMALPSGPPAPSPSPSSPTPSSPTPPSSPPPSPPLPSPPPPSPPPPSPPPPSPPPPSPPPPSPPPPSPPPPNPPPPSPPPKPLPKPPSLPPLNPLSPSVPPGTPFPPSTLPPRLSPISTPPSPSPVQPPATPTPPRIPRPDTIEYRCKNNTSLKSAQEVAVKLSPLLSEQRAAAECRGLCDEKWDECSGYYYKRTGFCTLVFGPVQFSGKMYPSDVEACILRARP